MPKEGRQARHEAEAQALGVDMATYEAANEQRAMRVTALAAATKTGELRAEHREALTQARKVSREVMALDEKLQGDITPEERERLEARRARWEGKMPSAPLLQEAQMGLMRAQVKEIQARSLEDQAEFHSINASIMASMRKEGITLDGEEVPQDLIKEMQEGARVRRETAKELRTTSTEAEAPVANVVEALAEADTRLATLAEEGKTAKGTQAAAVQAEVQEITAMKQVAEASLSAAGKASASKDLAGDPTALSFRDLGPMQAHHQELLTSYRGNLAAMEDAASQVPAERREEYQRMLDPLREKVKHHEEAVRSIEALQASGRGEAIDAAQAAAAGSTAKKDAPTPKQKKAPAAKEKAPAKGASKKGDTAKAPAPSYPKGVKTREQKQAYAAADASLSQARQQEASVDSLREADDAHRFSQDATRAAKNSRTVARELQAKYGGHSPMAVRQQQVTRSYEMAAARADLRAQELRLQDEGHEYVKQREEKLEAAREALEKHPLPRSGRRSPEREEAKKAYEKAKSAMEQAEKAEAAHKAAYEKAKKKVEDLVSLEATFKAAEDKILGTN